MSNQISFIGREKEIHLIEKACNSEKGNNIILIEGDGGIGKTRLLQETRKILSKSRKSPFTTNILDFDEQSLCIYDNFELRLAGELKGIDVSPYSIALQDLRQMQIANISYDAQSYQREKVRSIFVSLYNQLSSKYRIVIFLDTVEKSEANLFWEAFAKFLSEVKNTTCILAGRRNLTASLDNLLSEEFNGEVNRLEIAPFNIEESKLYLEEIQEKSHIRIDPLMVKNLLFLSGGRPILLNIAVDCVARGISLDWLTNENIGESVVLSDLKIYTFQREFEKQLVSSVSMVRKPMDRLILTMSRIYPLNRDMIEFLLNVPAQEADALFLEASSHVFVKLLPSGALSLHDEMRRLVNTYVWTEIDPDNLRRKRDSRLAIQYYKELKQSIREQLENRNLIDSLSAVNAEILEASLETADEQLCQHLLFSDSINTFEEWKNILNESRISHRIAFAKRLIDSAQMYFPSLTKDQQFDFLLLEARLSNEIGQVDYAKEKLQTLLIQLTDADERRASVLNSLGLVEEKLGMIEKALEHQLECLEIVKRLNSRLVAHVSNRIGYLYRLMGDRLKADEYYRFALKTNSKIPLAERDQNLTASLFNNLGFVCGLERKYAQMELFCEHASEIWFEIGLKKEVGRSEITRAIFYRDQGNYLGALDLLKRAISRYDEPDDHEQLCRAYFQLGWTQWYIAEKANDQIWDVSLEEWDDNALSIALDYFQKSLKFARTYGLRYELPGVLHQTASVFWYLGRSRKDEILMKKARNLNHEAYEISTAVHDIRYAIDSLLGEAEWDYDIGRYDNIPNYDQKLQSEYSQFRSQYKLYFGRMHRIKADIAFRRREWETAFSNYAVGLGMVQFHRGFGRYTIQRELLWLLRKLKQLDENQNREWLQYLRAEWLKLEGKQDVDLLLGWCDQLELRGLSE